MKTKHYKTETVKNEMVDIQRICAPNLPDKPTQADYILAYLKTGRILTRLDTFYLMDIFEAPAVIVRLKSQGWPIKSVKCSFVNKLGFPGTFAIWYLDVYQCYRTGMLERPGTQRGLF